MQRIKTRILINSIKEMRAFSAETREKNASLGLVPTMGALHNGHLSLLERSVSENDLTVVSIFVNPIQFDNTEDLASYPETLASDTELAFHKGADVIFAPTTEEMYPDGFSTYIEMTGIAEKLCGESRLSHFRGVLTVVNKLFGICNPTRAYFGEKDIQQLSIVKKMVSDLCMNLEIVGCPTIREEDGLAMSSRNKNLTKEERRAAKCIYNALIEAKTLCDHGENSPDMLADCMKAVLKREPLVRIDYALLADPLNFETPRTAKKGDLLMIAVFIGHTRLIDNMRL